MRTSILCAAFLGLFAAGCAGELSGTGGDDQEPPENCGNNTMDSGETCDDGNTTSGDGCSSTCQTEGQQQTPRVALSLDKNTVNTELATTTMITVTVTGQMGFAGNVTLAATATDPAGAPLMGWTVTFDNATLTIPTNGTATAVATVKTPTQNSGLMGNVKIDATSTAAAVSATSAFTLLNQLTFDVSNTGGQCAYPTAATTTIKVGTKVRWVNKFTAGAVAGDRITIHVGGNVGGIAHEPDPGHLIDTAYEDTATAATAGTFDWYCHAPGPTVNTNKLMIVQ